MSSEKEYILSLINKYGYTSYFLFKLKEVTIPPSMYYGLYYYFKKNSIELAQKFMEYLSTIDLSHDSLVEITVIIVKSDKKEQEYYLNLFLDYYLEKSYDIDKIYELASTLDNQEIKNKVVLYLISHLEEKLNKIPLYKIFSYIRLLNNNMPLIEDYFLNHLSRLNEITDYNVLYRLLNISKQSMPKLIPYLNDFIDKHRYDIIKENYMLLYTKNTLDEKDIEAINYIDYIFVNLLKQEGILFHDCTIGNKGSYTITFIIGNRVVKLERENEIWHIPDSSYLARPILRERISLSDDKYLSLEVMPYAKTLKKDEVSVDELYELYYNLRKEGNIWVDIREDNVGILLQENDLSIKAEDLNMESIPGLKSIPVGSLVILDNDHRFRELQVPNKFYQSSWTNISYFQTFETLYQENLEPKALQLKK